MTGKGAVCTTATAANHRYWPEVTERSAGTHKRKMQQTVGAISNENKELKSRRSAGKCRHVIDIIGKSLPFVPVLSTLRTPHVPL
jgi:hypothetical protein